MVCDLFHNGFCMVLEGYGDTSRITSISDNKLTRWIGFYPMRMSYLTGF